MRSTQFENLLYGIGALLIIGGAILRMGHIASASLGFTLLGLGFGLGSVGRILTVKRMRQLKARNRELETQLADRNASS